MKKLTLPKLGTLLLFCALFLGVFFACEKNDAALTENEDEIHMTTIYLSLNNGILEYRDTEGNSALTTHAKHNSKIIWKLDENSGISEITGIKIHGDTSILNGKPRKVDFNQWEARASDEGEGEVSYTAEVVKCKHVKDEEVEVQRLKGANPPLLRIP